MKRMESAKKSSKSKSSLPKNDRTNVPSITSPHVRFVVCVRNCGHIDLEPLKVYRLRRDETARAQGLLRVVDGSGEDYLYPMSYFRPIQAPGGLFRMVKAFAEAKQ